MRNCLIGIILLTITIACSDKKSSSEEAESEGNGFINAYPAMKLPYEIADTNLKKSADTATTIEYSLFTQSIPDSIFNNPFGKDRNISLQPIGRFEQKGKEVYFLTKATNKTNSAVYLSVIDKDKFVVNMLLVNSNQDEKVSTASIDKKLSIVLNDEWTVKNDNYYKRIIYTYNNVGVFTTVLTETNEDRNTETAVSNPLDTFPKKYKYSGDYVKGSKNILSIRDGANTGEYLFFVHFTNDNKDDLCGGDLKGSLKMVSDKSGIYQGSGDPCALEFSFASNEIRVKETGGCGNYRGIKCFFNDTYLKKKEAKTFSKKK